MVSYVTSHQYTNIVAYVLEKLTNKSYSRLIHVRYIPITLQIMMFGYATDETEELMPMSIMLAHKLNRRMDDLRRDGGLPWARPDSKSQVSKF